MRETGIFEYLAIWAAKRARGRPFPLMVLLILITAVASALLDNVTTVLLVAPVTILLCQRLALPVVPYLLAEVFASNIGGTATLVGDPPNIIIASRGGLSFNDFLVHLAPVVVVLVVRADRAVPVAVRRRVPHRRGTGRGDPGPQRAGGDQGPAACSCSRWSCSASCWSRSSLSHSARLRSRRWWRCSAPGCWSRSPGSTTETALQDVEWGTLAFFMGLFIMVGGLVNAGVLDALAGSDRRLRRRRPAGVHRRAAVGLRGAVRDRGQHPLRRQHEPGRGRHHRPRRRSRSSCGGRWRWAPTSAATPPSIGASANVVVAGIAARNGTPISFWRFTRYGLVVAAATLRCRPSTCGCATSCWPADPHPASWREQHLQQVRRGQQAAHLSPSSTTTSSGLRSRAISAAHSTTVASPSTLASSTRCPLSGSRSRTRLPGQPVGAQLSALGLVRTPGPATGRPGCRPARRTAGPATRAAPPPDARSRRPPRSPAADARRSAGPRPTPRRRDRRSAAAQPAHGPSPRPRYPEVRPDRRPIHTQL